MIVRKLPTTRNFPSLLSSMSTASTPAHPSSTPRPLLIHPPSSNTTYTPRRCLHQHVPRSPVPAPTPFVPDHQTFLTLIGRDLSKHAGKFTSWEELFTTTSSELRSRGIEPPRSRRYLLRWREKFRRGEYGFGGDLQHVTDGVAEMRVVEVPARDSPHRGHHRRATPTPTEADAVGTTNNSSSSNSSITPIAANTKTTTTTIRPRTATTKLIVNVPSGSKSYVIGQGETTSAAAAKVRKVSGTRLRNGHIITGPYVQLQKGTNGSVATLKAVEGLWEHRRGHKVDGGERRQAEVRHKRRVEERRKERS